MCGFADASYTATAVRETDEVLTLGEELMHPLSGETLPKSPVDSKVIVDEPDAVSTTISNALIDCPACSTKVSESAVNCPKCGLVLTPAIVEAQRSKRAQAELAENCIQAVGAAGGLIVFGLLWAAMSNASNPSSNSVATNYTPAQKAVYLDRGNFGVGATARMQTSLSRLSTKYSMSEELIASKLVVAQELLAKEHVHLTIQQIADSIETANPTTIPVQFDELLASFVTLCGKRTDPADDHSHDGGFDPAALHKRKMFYELVAAQDAGVGDERAYFLIAERYNVSVDAVREIAVEGAAQNWPMP
jgi:hypothetical protein